jgi:hypothetical protein
MSSPVALPRPTKEEAAVAGGGGLQRPVVFPASSPTRLATPGIAALHHQYYHNAHQYQHSPTSPRRNLVPTVLPRTIASPVVNVRTRSYSLGNVPPIGALNHPVLTYPWAGAAGLSGVPHSTILHAANSEQQLSAPFLLQQDGASSSSPPPEPSESCRAMEAAVAQERQRAQKMEAMEATVIDAQELKAILKAERKRMAKMAGDLAAMKTSAVRLQLEAKVHEEGRINGLWRQMDNLQQEKERMIVELEQEEDMVRHFF